MWLTENTVDAWTAVAIAEVSRNAAIWCPTPRRQHVGASLPPLIQVLENLAHPWDIAVGMTDRFFAIENKGLYEAPNSTGKAEVRIDLTQLAALETLESQGFPIFYGLPCPDPLPTGRSPIQGLPGPAQQRTRFASWQRIGMPHQVRTLVRDARETGTNHKIRWTDPKPAASWPTLGRFLAQVMCCRKGVPLSRLRDRFPDLVAADIGLFVVVAAP